MVHAQRVRLRGLLFVCLGIFVFAPAAALGQLSTDVLQALRAAESGSLSAPQQALLFQNNDAINRARLNGWITDGQYQAAQRDFASLNRRFAEQAAREAGAEFTVQKDKPGKPKTFSPGTDSDYIVKVKSQDPVGDIRRMQTRYNELVNEHLKTNLKGAAPHSPKSNWHNQLDVDFMADPKYVTDDQFKQIAKLNNDAYKRRGAAEYERISRLNDGTPVSPGQFKDYAREMQDFIAKKQKLMDEIRKNPAVLNDSNKMAEYHRLMAQEQKYIERIEAANAKLRTQEGLRGSTDKFSKPVYEVVYDKDGNALIRKRSEPSIAARGSVRSPDTRATTIAASGVAENSANRAIGELADSMAEAAAKNPGRWGAAMDHIAELTDGLSPSEKGRIIEQIKARHGDAAAAKAAEAMRNRAKAATVTPSPGALSRLDGALGRALGVNNDLSKLSGVRKRFNEAAARALGDMENIGKLGVAVEVVSAANNMRIWWTNLQKAIDSNTPEEEAIKCFERAQAAAQEMIRSGGLGALLTKMPTLGAAYGGWMMGFDGTRYILTNTETGEEIDRWATDFFDRHQQALDSASDQLKDFLGVESGRAQREEELRQLEEAFLKAIRDGRLRLKPGFSTRDVVDCLRTDDLAGAWERVERVQPDQPQPVLTDFEQETVTLEALHRRVAGYAREAMADADRASAQLAALRALAALAARAQAIVLRTAGDCGTTPKTLESIAADARGAVEGEKALRGLLDSIDARAGQLKTSADRERVLSAYAKALELAERVGGSSRLARDRHSLLLERVSAARAARIERDAVLAQEASASEKLHIQRLAAIHAESTVQLAQTDGAELPTRIAILRGQMARIRMVFQASAEFGQRCDAIEARLAALGTPFPVPPESIVQRAAAARTAGEGSGASFAAALAAIRGAHLCDGVATDAAVVESAEQSAMLAALRAAQSELIRQRVEAWKPGDPPPRVAPPTAEDLAKGVGGKSGQGKAPSLDDLAKGIGVSEKPDDPRPSTEPQPRPAPVRPRPQPQPVQEPEEKPVYAIYGVHSYVNPPAHLKGADLLDWYRRQLAQPFAPGAQPSGHIAFRVSGDVLKQYREHMQAVADGTKQGEFALFRQAGRYHQSANFDLGGQRLIMPLFLSFTRLEEAEPAWVLKTNIGLLPGQVVGARIHEMNAMASAGSWTATVGGRQVGFGAIQFSGENDWNVAAKQQGTQFLRTILGGFLGR